MEKHAITLTTVTSFGPAMSALTDKQRAFVISFNNSGGKNAAECARAAGYSDTGDAAKVSAYRLLHDPRLQAAIIEDVKARLVGDLAETFDLIGQIAANPQHKDQLKALTTKLHHAGMIETTRQESVMTVNLGFDEKVAKLLELCRTTGRDPATVLPPHVLAKLQHQEPAVTDAEFEEVSQEGDIPGLEGLV